MPNKISKFNIKLIVVVLTIACTLALVTMQHSDDEEALIDKYNSLSVGQGGTTDVDSVAKSMQQAQNQSQNKTVPGVASSDWCEFFQGNYPGVAYSTSTIPQCGCGLCSTCVVAEHYTGNTKKYVPNKMTKEVVSGSLGSNKSTSAITNFFNNHKEIPVNCSGYKAGRLNLNELDKTLAAGGCYIVDYHGSSHGVNPSIPYNGTSIWTGPTGGHYVVVCGGNQKDGYEVRDSNGGHNSGTRGVSSWAPYNKHKFEAKYVQPSNYYYVITPK